MKRKGPARDIKKELFWRGILRQHGLSGLNIREFCRKKGLREPLFYAWRREVKRRGRIRTGKISRPISAGSVRLAPSKSAKRNTNGAAFVPVRFSAGIAPSLGLTAVECLLPSGVMLRLPSSMEPAAIAAIVRAWEQGRC